MAIIIGRRESERVPWGNFAVIIAVLTESDREDRAADHDGKVGGGRKQLVELVALGVVA